LPTVQQELQQKQAENRLIPIHANTIETNGKTAAFDNTAYDKNVTI
jgi:hypothetical protein